MEKHQLNTFIEFSDDRFTKRVIFNDGNSTVFVLNFKPGQALPKHKHPGTNVYVLLVDGGGQFTIDDKLVEATANDFIVCTGDEEFSFVNTGTSNVSLFVTLNKLPNENYGKNI